MAQRPLFRKTVAWTLLAAMINPAAWPQTALARDTDIFLSSSSGGTGEPNILIILDTSDSMNIPEPWREYPGEYDSHVEYLWNDRGFINNISRDAPPVLTQYGSWAGATENARERLRDAARDHADATDPLDAGISGDNARKIYRNYNNANWVYWLPAGTGEDDRRLRSPSFNRWAGGAGLTSFGSINGNGDPVMRGGISYGNNNTGDMSKATEAGKARMTAADARGDFRAFNKCASSYEKLLPSTVFAPTTYPRNSGKLLNQQWQRWERFADPDNSLTVRYRGADATVATTGGVDYAQGYLDGNRDNNFPPFTGFGAKAGFEGQPIRTAGTTAKWGDLRPDLGGFYYATYVNDLPHATLKEVLSWYGINAAGLSATDARFTAWQGTRDPATPPAGNDPIGTPAYYDKQAALTINVVGDRSRIRNCTQDVPPTADDTDAFGALRKFGGTCKDGSPVFSGDGNLAAPPACTPGPGNQNFTETAYRDCAWVAVKEGQNSCRGTCSGKCAVPFNSGENYCQVDGAGNCSSKPNIIRTCSERNPGFPGCRYDQTCSNQTTTAGGGPASYTVYNREKFETHLIHDCKADEGANGPWMTRDARSFDTAWVDGTNGNQSYTAASANQVAAAPAVDLYSVNYLNWKFGPKGPNGHPIGRKTRLQIAKDALNALVDATNGVRFGLEVFNRLPDDSDLQTSRGSEGGNIAYAVRRMGVSSADLPAFNNRAALKTRINNLDARAATPLTEALYEAYLYFRGETPRFGALSDTAKGGGGVSDGRDCSATGADVAGNNCSGGGNYVSPMASNPTVASPSACQKNFTVLITDGGPESDISANRRIQKLSYTSAIGATISPDTTVDSTQPDTSSHQLEDAGGNPYGPRDLNDQGYVWLDELAYYMNSADMNGDLPQRQPVVSYTIGFAGADSPVLSSAARNSDGAYYTADDSAALSEALTKAIAAIREWNPTVAAPTVPISALNRLESADDVYLAFFGPVAGQAWDGTVKKFKLGKGGSDCGYTSAKQEIALCLTGQTVLQSGYKNIEKVETDTTTVPPTTSIVVDPDTVSFWNPQTLTDGSSPRKGGVGSALISKDAPVITPDKRKVYTHLSSSARTALTDSANSLDETNTLITATVLGNSALTDAQRATLINFARGGNPAIAACSDASSATACSTWRPWAHADVLHSKPTVVTYDATATTTNAAGKIEPAPLQYLYYLSNDGLLHAIDAANGKEAWAFLVEEALPYLTDLKNNHAGEHLILADGAPAVYVEDKNRNGVIEAGDKIWLYFGMRRGGRAYYALDITNKDAPVFKWKITNDQICNPSCSPSDAYGELGQSWSAPAIGKVRAVSEPVLIFGGGYDANQDNDPVTADDTMGRALFVTNGGDGTLVRKFDNSDVEGGMTYSIPSEPAALNADLDAQGLLDRVYIGDTAANVYRFDINDADTGNWSGRKIAALSNATPPNRKIFSPPVMVKQNYLGQRYDAVYVGTGDREHPLAVPAAAPAAADGDKMFMIKDTNTGFTSSGAAANFPTDFVNISNVLLESDAAGIAPQLSAGKGWYLSFAKGEKVINSPTVFGNILRFGTYTPNIALNACVPPGMGQLYAINALYGGLVDTSGDSKITSGAGGDTRTYTDFQVRGFIPTGALIVKGKTVYVVHVADARLQYKQVGTIGGATKIYWYLEPEQ